MNSQDTGNDLAVLVSRRTAELTYDRLPTEAVAVLKRIVLDTLGTSLAANTLGEGVRPLVEVARQMGGVPESTLIGFGTKAPAVTAAWVNGGLAQALNYADTAEMAGHLGPVTVPAALATAERVGGVNGEEFLVSLAVGAELLSRLSRAFKLAWSDGPVKPLRTQLWGYFSAAVSAGRIMKLTAEEMHSALGLALMQASGSMQVVRGGDPPAKAVYAAFANHGGVLSALLSRQGLGASFAGVFEGEAGLFAMFHEGRYLRSELEDGLGETFHLQKVRFKPWPISGVVHSLVDATLQLVNDHKTQSPAIEHVHLRGGRDIGHCCEPVDLRKKPPTSTAASNSIFFPVAKVLVNGNLTLADFTPDGLRQPEALRISEGMTHSIEDDLGGSAVVEVTLTSAERLVCRVDKPLGHLSKPMSYSQIVNKFMDCAQYAATPLQREKLEELVDLVDHLEGLPNVSVLAGLLGGGR